MPQSRTVEIYSRPATDGYAIVESCTAERHQTIQFGGHRLSIDELFAG